MCVCVWQPDTWGEYVYDTAWMFAHAIADLRQRGVSPRDGRALRAALLNTSFGGVTGHITMGPDQDRAMASESASMHMAGSALADAFSHDRLLASPRLAPLVSPCASEDSPGLARVAAQCLCSATSRASVQTQAIQAQAAMTQAFFSPRSW